MIKDVENSRLYLPAEDPAKPNERTAIHPETNINQVLTDADGTTLAEMLGPQIVISSASNPPKKTGILWAEIRSTRLDN